MLAHFTDEESDVQRGELSVPQPISSCIRIETWLPLASKSRSASARSIPFTCRGSPESSHAGAAPRCLEPRPRLPGQTEGSGSSFPHGWRKGEAVVSASPVCPPAREAVSKGLTLGSCPVPSHSGPWRLPDSALIAPASCGHPGRPHAPWTHPNGCSYEAERA